MAAALPEGRRGSLTCELNEILKAVTLTPWQAAKIRGELGFAQSLMFCKYGRVQLQPFANRQYYRAKARRQIFKSRVMGRYPVVGRDIECGRAPDSFNFGAEAVVDLYRRRWAWTCRSGDFRSVRGTSLFFHFPGWLVDQCDDIGVFEMAGVV